jgi:hypothetical protein
MKIVSAYLAELYRSSLGGWNRFWFTPSDPATLGIIRILAGAMLLYTHLVWTIDLEAFFGGDAPWIDAATINELVFRGTAWTDAPQGQNFAWSIFWIADSTVALWTIHIGTLICFTMLTLGLFTRWVATLGFLLAVSYTNRAYGALFGLDQINVLLAFSLMIGPSGAAYSLDRWLARRRGQKIPHVDYHTGATVAVRLIQLHMCVIYFFAGIAKLQGPAWWSGEALWGAFANLEYQSLDMTGLAAYPVLIALLSHVSVAWELSYPFLIWPRLTRPIVVTLAVPMHLGIAFCMGMITFGLVMLIGNLAFVAPWLVRSVVERRDPRAITMTPDTPSPGESKRKRGANSRRPKQSV